MANPEAELMRVFLERVATTSGVPPWRAFRCGATAATALVAMGCGGVTASDEGGLGGTGAQPSGGHPGAGGAEATGGDEATGGLGLLYAMPLEDCSNGFDDDGDGALDCDDSECLGGYPCLAPPPYSIPFESDCTNGVDDDGDGAPDCGDPDCLDGPGCPCCIYAAPM